MYYDMSTKKAPNAIGMKRILIALSAILLAVAVNAQEGLKNQQSMAEGKIKVYNEDINPIEQIDQAVVKAKSEGKFVICQVGGNWCPWCLRFANFITNDTTISRIIDENFEYIHVNYNPRKSGGEQQQQLGSAALSRKEQAVALMKRLNNCGRFGFPVLVVLDEEGKVIHIQDSSFLEGSDPETTGALGEGVQELGYNREKVMRFFKNWTPKAVRN